MHQRFDYFMNVRTCFLNFSLTSFGIVEETADIFVKGIVDSIVQADSKLAPGRIEIVRKLQAGN